MNVAVMTSVSGGTPWAPLTTPNHAEYCLARGYTHIARHLPYSEAVADFAFVSSLLGHFDAVWCLDSDAVVTNMAARLDELPLASGANVCQEGLHDACPINCGSVIWTSCEASRWLLGELEARESEWRPLMWIWQQWMAERLVSLAGAGAVTVHFPRTFNSCHHGEKCLWQPGDFVYHPCGMPHSQRLACITERLKDVVR